MQKKVDRRRSTGQTLVLFLGFAAAMIGSMLVAFNSGQVTNAKMRALNAADAAAYSGAVFEARSLNFQAYMNRAMVLNEVTIAQSVSLRSWVSYLDRFVSNINTLTQFVPYLGVATKAVSKGLDAVDKVVQQVLPVGEIAMRGLNVVSHLAQNGVSLAGVAIAHDIAGDVAKLNGAEVSTGGKALFITNEAKWLAFTKTYSKTTGRAATDDRARMREVVLNSRDGFSQARDFKIGDPLGVIFELRKQGGTDLIDFDSWKALDSAELRSIKVPFKGWTVKVPVGWGGGQAYSPSSARRIGTHGNINEWTDADGRLASREANGKNAKNVQVAFQGYRDVRDTKTKKADLRVPFAIEVLIKDTAIPTANSAFGAKATSVSGGAIEHDAHYVARAPGTYALAEACVSFSRPYGGERADGAVEYPSLFNPYWRASMATESRIARGVVDSIKGLVPVGALLGSGSCT